MQQVILHVNNQQKAQALIRFLETLDFVDVISSVQSDTELTAADDFFSLAGLWQDYSITQETLRREAWRKNA